jgi:hypothetical protein
VLIGSLVSAETRMRIAADPWLNQYDWIELASASGLFNCHVDLLLLEADSLPGDIDLEQLSTPCWCFAAGARCWSFPHTVEAFSAPLDLSVLHQRLLAWRWLSGELVPACFSGHALMLKNGSLSFLSLDTPPVHLQVSVCPAGSVGGDIVLYVEQAGCNLLILADAIGHGAAAALDAALFALAVVQYLLPAGLTPEGIQCLNQSLIKLLGCGHFVAAAMIELDSVHGEIHLLNAGMPDVFHLAKGLSPQAYPAQHSPLGLPLVTDPCLLTLPLSGPAQWLICSDGVDSAALLRIWHLAQIDSTLYDNCIGEVGYPGHPPMLKVSEAEDDAAQVIVGIA